MKHLLKTSFALLALLLGSVSAVFALPEKLNTSNKSQKYVYAKSEDDKAMLKAVWNGNKEEVARLLEEGVFVDLCDSDGYSLLTLAAGRGHAKIAQILIDNKASLEYRTWARGFTPLMRAARNGRKDTIEVLVKAGADVNAIAYLGGFVLDFAYDSKSSNKKEVIELLKSYGAVGGVTGYKIPKSYEKAHSYRTGKPYEKMKTVPPEIEQFCESDPEKFVTELCALINKEAKNEFEKVKMAHDYVACNLKYGSNSRKTANWDFVLKEKRGVCRGFTNVLKKLLDTMDIPNVKCSGYPRQNGYFNERIKNNHIWNMVQIEGEWYFIDVTWDVGGSTAHLFQTPEAYRYTRYPCNYSSQQLMPNRISRNEFLALPYITPTVASNFTFDPSLKKINNVENGEFSFKYTKKTESSSLSFVVTDANKNKLNDVCKVTKDEKSPMNYTVTFSLTTPGTYTVSMNRVVNNKGKTYQGIRIKKERLYKKKKKQ